ncbi:MAG TPA: OsmC family protein [Gemmatimonadaceae bacterium]|nr:OsmC family protein [Gemmatimonadaceae bacterium]
MSRPPNIVSVAWAGDRRFDAGRPGGPTFRLDGDSADGQSSPVDALLAALGACVSVDVVDILKKQRTPPDWYEVEVIGTRVDTIPRKLKHVLLKVRVRGKGIERAQAERALSLAVTKYCSVRDSLDPAIPVEWDLTVEGG